MFFGLFGSILVLWLAVFGAYCAIRTVSEAFVSSDRIAVALEVREQADVNDMDMLLQEARSLSVGRGRSRVVVLISADLMDGTVGFGEELLEPYAALLDRYGADCYLIDP